MNFIPQNRRIWIEELNHESCLVNVEELVKNSHRISQNKPRVAPNHPRVKIRVSHAENHVFILLRQVGQVQLHLDWSRSHWTSSDPINFIWTGPTLHSSKTEPPSITKKAIINLLYEIRNWSPLESLVSYLNYLSNDIK